MSINTTQLELLGDIFSNTERPDKITINLKPGDRSITVEYEDLDDEWFNELTTAAMSDEVKCDCNYHLGMGPNLKCPVHGEDNRKAIIAAREHALGVLHDAEERRNNYVDPDSYGDEDYNLLLALCKEFIGYLDKVETSDNERQFHPNYISSCRVMDGERMGQILLQIKSLIDEE